MSSHAAGEPRADPAAVDAVLTASRSMVSVTTRSLGAAAEETTIAQYRALVVLVSRGPRRMVDLAEALRAFTDAAGGVPDSEWPPVPAGEGLAPRRRAPGQPGGSERQVPPASDRAEERA